jgi:hypothetical protein
MHCATILEFSAGILQQVGTKNRKYDEGKIGGGLESSQSSGQTVGCPVLLSGYLASNSLDMALWEAPNTRNTSSMRDRKWKQP